MNKPELTPGPRCRVCGKLLSGLKGSALTCSERCRKQKSRIAEKRNKRAVALFEAMCEEIANEAAIVDPKRNGGAAPRV